MAEYLPEELRKLQLTQLNILKDIIQICEEHGLTYFMTAGCAIGMERHQGFIPWDDDIDLGILRQDYERILDIIKKDYSDKYYILSSKEDSRFPFPHACITLKGTVCIPEMFEGAECAFGIDVALYPFDHVPDNDALMKKQARMLFLYSKLRILRDIKRPYLSMGPIKKRLVLFCCYLAHYGMKVTCISRKWLNDKYEKWATKYNDIPTTRVCCFFDTSPLNMLISRDELFPLQEKQFEDIMVKLPKDNHAYLTRMYGDYMKLPPVEKRKDHAPKILKFNDE